jgi:hypothetical protein
MIGGYSEFEKFVGEAIAEKYDYNRSGPDFTNPIMDIEEVRRDLKDVAEHLRGNWWCDVTGGKLEITGLVDRVNPDKPGNLFSGKDQDLGEDRTFSLNDLRLMDRRE